MAATGPREKLDRAVRRRLAASRDEKLNASKRKSKRRRAKHLSTATATAQKILRHAALASKCSGSGQDGSTPSDGDPQKKDKVPQHPSTSDSKSPGVRQPPSEVVNAQLSLLRKLVGR